MPPTSDLIGKTVVEAEFPHPVRTDRDRPAARRVAHERNLLNETLQVGDTLLLIGPWNDIEQLQSGNSDLVVAQLPAELERCCRSPARRRKRWSAWCWSSD